MCAKMNQQSVIPRGGRQCVADPQLPFKGLDEAQLVSLVRP